MRTILQQTISSQRDILANILKHPLSELVFKVSSEMSNISVLEERLQQGFSVFKHSKYLYIMDASGIQITHTISHDARDANSLGRDRSKRPYMQNNFQKNEFFLSEGYISKHNKRPSITAIHVIKDKQEKLIGYLGIDYDLRELPGTNHLYTENYKWQQIKGDPAIRSGLFSQQRLQSQMDSDIDNIFALMQELIYEHGIFHGKFHFSSSRTTIWLLDDPYNYRLLSMQELTDPDICLVYPRHNYSDLAVVPKADIVKIFEYFRQLRFADETVYLRAGSINIINGMISLNFSCDGTHYLPYQEFLDKGMSFWFGASDEVEKIDPYEYDEIVESICTKGCKYVYKLIEQFRQDNILEELVGIPQIDQNKIIKELETIMQVYSD